MAHVGGGFIYLATHAVVGEMLKHGKKLVLTSFALGVALIAVLNVGLRLLRYTRSSCRGACAKRLIFYPAVAAAIAATTCTRFTITMVISIAKTST